MIQFLALLARCSTPNSTLVFWSIKMTSVSAGAFRKISKKNLIQTVSKGQRYNRFKLCNWSLEIFQQCFLAKLWQEPSLSQAFGVRGLPDTSIHIWHFTIRSSVIIRVGYTIHTIFCKNDEYIGPLSLLYQKWDMFSIFNKRPDRG